MTFDSLGLAPAYLRAVADEGYTEPTPVQAKAIPIVLAGRDLLAGAQTGTGKTAAFVLPMLQRLHDSDPGAGVAHGTHSARPGGGRATRPTPPVRALVLAPTRELALQVEESVRTYGRHRPMTSVAIYGGVGFNPQVASLRRGAPIVVATPGRLLDHVSQGTIDLSRVEILVLDEADRMLDMGFIRDIRKVLALLPPRRQNLLFSATFSDEIRELASGFLVDPASVDVAPRNTAAELVEQVVIPVDRERKRDLLRELVALGRVTQALVFTRTKHGANRLALQLGHDGIPAAAIHGNKSQNQRVKALDDFKAGRVGILVATDIAARGLDIEQLPTVVNYELPMVAADYVHRIGRTGRAGETGEAISLVCVDETPLLRDIQKLLGRQLPSEIIEGFTPDRSIRAEPIKMRSGDPGHRERGVARGGGGGRGPRRPMVHAAAEASEVVVHQGHGPSHGGAGHRPSMPHVSSAALGHGSRPVLAMPGERLRLAGGATASGAGPAPRQGGQAAGGQRSAGPAPRQGGRPSLGQRPAGGGTSQGRDGRHGGRGGRQGGRPA